MKKAKIIFTILTVILLCLTLELTSCSDNKEEKESTDSTVEVNAVKLDSLMLDDSNYSLDFKSDVFEYTVRLPDGRPPIPRVNATAGEGVTYEIFQAVIPDGKTSGSARIVAKDGAGNKSTYTVTFEKDASVGFVLQYDDRYTLTLGKEANDVRNIVFESENEDVVSVTRSGTVHAKKVSRSPVTVTAKSEGQTVQTFVIDRIEKAHVNLFLITGQSSAQGCYSNTTMKDPDLNAKQIAKVEKIGGDGRVYSYDVHPRSTNTEVYKLRNTLYDMNTVNKQGVQNALGKTWYDLSGEKVVFLQTSYSGAPIQSWLDPKKHDEAGRYTSSLYNFYEDTKKGYSRLITLLEDNYEIIRVANFWNQGGTAMASVYSKEKSDYITSSDPAFDSSKLLSDADYYRLFMLIHNDMKEDFGVEVCGIFLNRALSSVVSAESKSLQQYSDLVPIRSAQYGLHNTVPEISLVSRVGDFAKLTTWKNKDDYGYGFVDTDNTHYTQIGYNERGRVAATTAFEIWVVGNSADGVEIVGENGRDRLTSNDTVTIKKGDHYRLAGYALPEGSGEKTVLTSSDEKIATVDIYGVVRGIGPGRAVITAATESGKTQSVNVEIYETADERVTYRWDFNDLTCTGIQNNLTMSEAAKHYKADNYYTISGGIYSVKSGASKNNRADFLFEYPVTLNSESDWEIEWRGKISSSCALLATKHTDFEGDVTAPGYIYLAYAANFGNDSNSIYPLRFVPEEGNILTLPYGDKRMENKEMNTWRLSYNAQTNMMTLFLSEDDGETWEELSSKKAGVFTTTFDSVFGRMRGNGYLNYNGSLDYLKIDCISEKIK